MHSTPPAPLPKPTTPFVWADYLRVFATCSVVFLHFSGTGVRFPPNSGYFWVGNVFDSAVRACVPLFVMLTGALVLPSDRPLFDYLRRRMSRVLLPAFFWSLIYLAYYYFLQRAAGNLSGVVTTIKWAYGSLQVGTEFHLWYVYMIAGIFLFIPVLGRWIRSAPDAELLYFLAIWAVTLFGSYPLLYKYRITVELRYFSGYAGYLVLGYYLAHRAFNPVLGRRLAVAAIAVGFAITVLGTYVSTVRDHGFAETFYNYLTPNVGLMAAGIFYLFRQARLPGLSRIGQLISQNSYNIYLGHVLIMRLLAQYGLDAYSLNPLLGVPLFSFVCLLLAGIIAWSINKSFLGKFIGG